MDQVEEVKQKVDIVELVGEYLPLKRAGHNFKGLCPFHAEKTPSFMVNPEMQIFKCFGCSLGGDVYTFLQKIEGMEFGEALASLAQRVGVKLVSFRPSQTEEVRQRLLGLNSLAAQFYHYLLVKHAVGQKARQYVAERGVSPEALEKFNLGYAPSGRDYLIKFLVGKKKYSLADLDKAGLIVGGRTDRFRERLMFPLNDHRGQTVGFTGRVLPPAKEEAGGKYVNTPQTTLYHKSELVYGLDITRAEIKAAGWVVVVEGQMDLIPSWQAGVTNVVAMGGTALTGAQVERLRRLCDTLTLALDTDLAGDAAARRGIETAEARGFMVKVVKLKGAKDPGEIASADPGAWRQAVAAAVPIYDFYLESAVDRYGLDIAGKKRVAGELLPIWARIEDQIIKAHYIKKLAGALGVGEEAIRSELGKVANPPGKAGSGSAGKSQTTMTNDSMTKRSRREVVEEYLVGLAVKAKKPKLLAKRPVKGWIKTPFWARVVGEFKAGRGVKELPAELKGGVEELFLSEGEYSLREWARTLRELEKIDVRERIEQLRRSGRIEQKGKQLVKLTARLGELTKQS